MSDARAARPRTDGPDVDSVVPVSVVIPAHDEEAVIERCLGTLLADARAGEVEVVVVCNGCTDDTAARAHDTRVGGPATGARRQTIRAQRHGTDGQRHARVKR